MHIAASWVYRPGCGHLCQAESLLFVLTKTTGANSDTREARARQTGLRGSGPTLAVDARG